MLARLRNCIWQQDGATPHQAVTELIQNHVPDMIILPAYSPDLSPNEQIWPYFKQRLRGRTFNKSYELFEVIR